MLILPILSVCENPESTLRHVLLSSDMRNSMQKLVSSKYHGDYYCKISFNSLLNSPIFVFTIVYEMNSYEPARHGRDYF